MYKPPWQAPATDRAQGFYDWSTKKSVAVLNQTPSKEAINHLVQELGTRIDQECEPINRATNPDCERGCCHCCFRVVRVRIPEVLQIAGYVAANFSEEQKQILKERLYRYEREVAPSFGKDLHLLRPQCPMLEDGLCSIYPVRPFMCRGIFSPDANGCEQAKLHPQTHSLPALPEQLKFAQAASTGLQNGLTQAQLEPNTYDFGRALKMALEDANATEEWLQGENSFGSALIPSPPNAVRPPQIVPPQRQYRPGEQPTGQFDPRGLMLPQHLSFREGDLTTALKVARGSHPAYAMWRIRVPNIYSSEDEVLEWRHYFQQAMREFAASNFDPRQAYDGISVSCPHDLVYQQYNNRELLSELGDLTCNRISARALPDLAAPIEKPRKPGRIRIGYISRHLVNSSSAPWGLGWIRNQSKEFETYSFFLGEAEDNVTRQFKAASEHYYHLPPRQNVVQQARMIRGLDLDALIYLDINIHSATNQFASLRLARNQFGAWGGPETSGLPSIDYYLSSDWMEIREADEHYSEKLVRLPRIGVCYLRENIRASTLERADFGFGDEPIYLSLQHAAKFAPQWDGLYLRINEATGQPVYLFDRPIMNQRKFFDRLARKGVKFKLIPLLKVQDYMALIKMADVVLDTPGWNGGITTVHAIDCGTPVVTLPTELKRGRQSLGLLRAARAEGLVAKDLEDYIDLVANRDRREAAAREMDPNGMYSDLGAVRALEDFIRSLV